MFLFLIFLVYILYSKYVYIENCWNVALLVTVQCRTVGGLICECAMLVF